MNGLRYRIGEIIGTARTESDMSRAKLGQISGVSQWAIRGVENGDSLTNFALIERMLDAVGLELEVRRKEGAG